MSGIVSVGTTATVSRASWFADGDHQDSYLELLQRLGSQSDALRRVLEETLRKQQVLVEFQVQPRTSERTMPTEDASIEWPESESPFRTVAHLLLTRQEIAMLRQQAAMDSFEPASADEAGWRSTTGYPTVSHLSDCDRD